MKDLIRKILKENEADFSWVSEIGSDMPLGEKLSEDEIELSGDNLVVTLDTQYWFEHFLNMDDSNSWYLEMLMAGRSYYDYDNYLDRDEFNYIIYMIDENNRERINELMRLLGIEGEVKDYDNNLYDLFQNFEKIKDPEPMINDVVDHLGYNINKNRWSYLEDRYSYLINSIKKDTGTNFRLSRSNVKITIPITYVFDKISEGFDLTQIVKKVSNPLDEGWSDMYYDEYNTSGSEREVNDVLDSYLVEVLEEVKSNEEISEYIKFIETLKKLNFEPLKNKKYWHKFIEDMGVTNEFIVDSIDISELNCTVTIVSPKGKKQYEVSFQDFPSFVYNYKLDL